MLDFSYMQTHLGSVSLALFGHTLLYVAAAVFIYMTFWFLVSLITKKMDVADTAWGLGFVVAVLVPLLLYGVQFDRALFAFILVFIWGTRLSLHITKRNAGRPEDKRYAAMRADWGSGFLLRSYLQVFLLQGGLLLLVVSPVLFIATYRGGALGVFDIIGAAVWLFGFFFESQGDAQLRKFLATPDHGPVMDQGLWKYTRHPNYFGEVTQWWGLWIIALGVPFGYLGIIGPLTITGLILFVSGVPLLEKSMAGKPAWEAYKKRTSVFIPLPPRKAA